MNIIRPLLALLLLSNLPRHAVGQVINAQPFVPVPTVVQPFGYGPVLQTLLTSATASGTATCSARHLICLSVSGGNGCSSQAPSGAIVSCGFKPNTVNENNFAPVNCNGNAAGDGGVSGLLGPNDFCLIANYMPQRTVDTLYQYNDYVRLGVNLRFGGTIMELYGNDKLDRILQNSGGGTQLSLWAYTTGYAPANLSRAWYAISSTASSTWETSWNVTPYETDEACAAANPSLSCQYGVAGPNFLDIGPVFPCAPNGQAAGSPINPIQGASPGCQIGTSGGSIDSVSSTGPGVITVSKSGPAQFTQSSSLPSVSWSQTTSVPGPYAQVTYSVTDTSGDASTSFQQIPAINLHNGMGSLIFFYNGPNPYKDVAGSVMEFAPVAGDVYSLQLPHRTGPFGTGAEAQLSEDWISSCDSTGTRCITIATFGSATQDMIVITDPDTPYSGVHGFFSLGLSHGRVVTVFLFPYRFDQVVAGQSVRAWIYQLSHSLMYKR